jgi:biotin transport system substrate-specific component
MPTFALSQRAPRSRAIGILAAVAAVSVAAQLAIPLPGTPVPLTLQPMLVVLAGLVLGPVDAAMAMIVYLLAGAMGLPVFTPIGAPGIARLLGPTGGYLLAYPVAAAVAGRLGALRETYGPRALAALAGMLTLYAGGLAQLTVLTGSVSSAVLLGVLPFAAADVVKALAAAALTSPRRTPAR